MGTVRTKCSSMVAKTPIRIERQINLRAARSRVWRALTDAQEFGTWFGVALTVSGPFEPKALVSGRLTVEGYDHVTLEMEVERVEPESYFSYRWHPYAVEPGVDYSKEPTTLVEFHLEELAGGGTALTVIESGFEHIPLARRAKAFEMNDGGWAAQMENIARHVAT
jgi:uncharacterized protein YndB with AHSA1/START domain